MDAKRKKKHGVDEAKYMEQFRKKLKLALEWDYERAKREQFHVSLGYDERQRRPKCPEGVEAVLDRAIAEVVMDGRQRYVISKLPRRNAYGDTTELYWLLTHDENAKPDVCA